MKAKWIQREEMPNKDYLYLLVNKLNEVPSIHFHTSNYGSMCEYSILSMYEMK